jgi:hypothetical protein
LLRRAFFSSISERERPSLISGSWFTRDWKEKPRDQGILQLLARTGGEIDDQEENDLEEDEEELADSEDDPEPDQ